MLQHINKTLIDEQINKFPSTRYMGSKSKLINIIWNATSELEYNSVLDLFSGSGIVSYMFKVHGKKVISNDYMSMGSTITKALIENNTTILAVDEAKSLLVRQADMNNFVQDTFKDLYFTDEDNLFIDIVRNNIMKMDDEYKKAIAMSALIRTCMKKRPRGIFTYVGNRYDDGRKDLVKTFEEHFLEAIITINQAVLDNKQNNKSYNLDAMLLEEKADLIYIDPPYYTPKSDNEYVRRYHFVEGLARNWEGVELQMETKTKKFKSYPTPFSKKESAKAAFEFIFNRYKDSILIVSYSSNSLPTKEEMISLMKKYKDNVEVIPVDYRYSFGNRTNTERNEVKEYIFVGVNNGEGRVN